MSFSNKVAIISFFLLIGLWVVVSVADLVNKQAEQLTEHNQEIILSTNS